MIVWSGAIFILRWSCLFLKKIRSNKIKRKGKCYLHCYCDCNDKYMKAQYLTVTMEELVNQIWNQAMNWPKVWGWQGKSFWKHENLLTCWRKAGEVPEGSRGVLCASGWVRPKDHLLDVLNVTFRVRTSQISRNNPVLHFGSFLRPRRLRQRGGASMWVWRWRFLVK